MMKRCAWLVLIALAGGPMLWAQAESSSAPAAAEDEFFGTADVEAVKGTAEKIDVQQEIDKERVGLSGILQATGSYTVTRAFVNGSAGLSDNSLGSVMSGDFLVDVRLKKSFRAFVDLSLGYLTNGAAVVHTFTPILPPGPSYLVSENQTTLLGVKEFFVDFNIANAVYFRAGKQVLQWGTGYFWNPTDLINIEHKSFGNLDALREGVFGLRSDVVFSPKIHLYTFLNFNAVENISDAALAARMEFLVGSFEFAFSSWFKATKIPVFGVDFTTPLFWSLNLTGEASLSWGDNQKKLDTSGAPYSIRDRVVPKIDVGLSRSFDAFDVQDRISVNAEFFYNDSGYDENMFEKLPAFLLPTFFSGYYQPGFYGKYYAALFVTVNKFILSDMTLALSGLGNLSDLSGIVMVSLSYAPVNNFSISLQLGSYIGGSDTREYTMSYNPTTSTLGNNMFVASLGAKVSF
jgi:hypothetical protein